MIEKTINDLNLGERAKFSKTISESDIYLYAGITGDFNPVHINKEYAKNTFFKKRIAHGMLIVGFISTVIGTKLPGYGTIYISQHLNFIAPAYIGDTVTTTVEIVDILLERNRVKLRTICKNQNEDIILSGEAVVSPSKIKC